VITLSETGGAQKYAALLAGALGAQCDVTVAAGGSGPLRAEVEAAGAAYVELRHMTRRLRPWRDVRALAELYALMRHVRPDVVHANSSKAGALGRLAAWLAGVPVRIFTAHGWAFSAARGPTAVSYRAVERALRPLTTHVICVAESELHAGIRTRACTARRASVIRNPAGPEAARNGGNGGRADGAAHVLSVGRLAAPKDFLTLVRAVGRLPEGTVRLSVAGAGPDRGAVAAEVERLGVGGRVALLGERTDVADLLAGADVFALSSRSEAMPMSILEAMASGLPVVATDVGGIPELVVDGKTGYLVPPARPDLLARALDRLAGDPGLRSRMGAAARARARDEFSVEAFGRAHLELYRRLLAERGLPSP
jgi:glycosyltransferase involved in cell wall biosynthesis